MAKHLHLKADIRSEFLLMIFLVHSCEDLFRALGEKPLPKRKKNPRLESKLCSQSYNEPHVFEVRHAHIRDC